MYFCGINLVCSCCFVSDFFPCNLACYLLIVNKFIFLYKCLSLFLQGYKAVERFTSFRSCLKKELAGR